MNEIDLSKKPDDTPKLPRGVMMMELNGRIMFVRRTAGGFQPVPDEEAIRIAESLKRG